MDANGLATLAQSGAAAIVGAMATDAWNSVRDRVARLLGSNDSDARSELEVIRDDIVVAMPEERDLATREAVAELRGRLKERMRCNELQIQELMALIADIQSAPGSGKSANVVQNAIASDRSSITQIGGNGSVGRK